MNENWRAVVGYEGLYEVSDQGRVRSLKFGKTRILKYGKAGAGYLVVNLCKDGKHKLMYVHRLVAEAFIQNPNNLETVNHKDEVKTNNAASNLEWMTRKDNINYGTHNKAVSETLKKYWAQKKEASDMELKKKVNVNPKDCVIRGINTDTGEEEWFLNVASAVKVIGCTRPQVYNVLNKVGYCKTAKGWRLEWVDFNDVVLKQKKTKKSNFEVQVHEDGDQVSEAEYWRQVENMLK